jgi:hypothetical protein
MSRAFIISALGLVVAAVATAARAAVASPAGPPAPASGSGGTSVVLSGGGWSLEVKATADNGAPEAAAAPAVEPARERRVSIAAPPADTFVPDVYPSQTDAARGLGEQWVGRAAERWHHEPASVRIYCCDPAIYAAVADGVRSRLPQARVEKAPADQCPDGFAAGTPGDGEAWMAVDVTPAKMTVKGRQVGVASGTLSLASKGATDATVSARFVDKPWLSNFAAFSHGQPRRWVVGRSDPLRPAMSEGEAARAARESAAGELFDLVRPRVSRGDDEWLRRRLEAKLAGGRLVIDQFPQKFERRFGSTWREAVLVDASPENLNQISRELFNEQRAQRKSVFLSAASGAGVLLVTYSLYRLANAFTRGYFVWSLRTAAAVVASAAVVLLHMVIG